MHQYKVITMHVTMQNQMLWNWIEEWKRYKYMIKKYQWNQCKILTLFNKDYFNSQQLSSICTILWIQYATSCFDFCCILATQTEANSIATKQNMELVVL